MNWKIVGIVAVAVLSLIGIGGGVYGGVKMIQGMLAGQRRAQCNNKDPNISIAGCTAILQSHTAGTDEATYAHFRRAIAYERKGDLDHAIQDDNEVIRANPREYMAYNSRGFAYQKKGDLDHAIADYSQAISIAPEMTMAIFNRGMAYSLKGQYAPAIDDFSHVIKLEPNNAMAWNNRCYYRAIADQLDDALTDCNHSLQLIPGVPAVLDSRAFTYLKMKKYDLALKDYDDAVKQDNHHAGWLYGRGLTRRALHDEAGSKADIAAALQIDPKVAEQFRKYGVS